MRRLAILLLLGPLTLPARARAAGLGLHPRRWRGGRPGVTNATLLGIVVRRTGARVFC